VVCFVPDGAAVTPAHLADAVRRLQVDPQLSAVGVGAGVPGSDQVTFFGLSWHAEYPRARREVLAVHGGAVAFKRAALEAVGGYADDLGDTAAELDVGWRLWLAGGTVQDLRHQPDGEQAAAADAPDAAGEAAASAAGSSIRPRRGDQVDAGAFVDALTVAWRCFDDTRAAGAIAGALLLAPHIVREEGAASVLPALSKSVAASRAIRAAVQDSRTRHDVELLHLLGRPLELPWLEPAVTDHVLGELALDQLFGRRRRVLVVTGDVIGPGMAGPAIRAWHMAECLADEHDVVLATTSGRALADRARFGLEAPGPTRFEQLVEWCDVVVVQGFVLLHVPALRRADRVMVVDGYDILHLEALELEKGASSASKEHVDASLHALNDQAARGDFFICASERQRDYWIGHLSALGRVNASTYARDPLLRTLVDVVPFGLPPDEPKRTGPGPRETVAGIGPDDDVLVWGGGIYDWLDPATLIRAVERLRSRRPNVRLVFMGMRHPNPEVPVMAAALEARQLARSLGLEDRHVFFNAGWVEYDSRQNWLLDADIGVSTHLAHAETAFAFRTRLLDYLWAGLPIVATAGDAFADLIAEEGLGRVVEPGDVEGLEQALYELLSDPQLIATCREHLERVRRRFEWPTTLQPLLRFCRQPAQAVDRLAMATGAGEEGVLDRLARRSRAAAALYAQGGGQAVLGAAGRRLRRGRSRDRQA
jgi:glycosyltransferase involved in cell wall biosynthesis